MKKLLLGILSIICILSVQAQNHFVYVRYNPQHGNASAIVQVIDQIETNEKGKVVVFCSRESNPIIARERSEWEELRSHILVMQTAYGYYHEDECSKLNALYTEIFNETVEKQLRIIGSNDASWMCTFILSESIMKSEESEALIENIVVNELPARMDIKLMIYNEKTRLTSVQLPKNGIFNYNIVK